MGYYYSMVQSNLKIAIYFLILSNVEYATDEEWSRILGIIFILLALIIGFTIVDVLYVNNKILNLVYST